MELLIWIGTGLAILGLMAIGYCIVVAIGAKRAKLSDSELRARLQRVVPINMGAVLASVLGMMSVVVGVVMGG
ncbi:hypothetical protein GTA62_00305 [Roseobacter sp. HKCCD9010]|jgi:hypothetical protein|uniref:hypothetical protein n=1 Tax=Rhodobacterales TaxID=204455 RepID=UPI0011998BE4|nr:MULTISPECIES: hypothetical protein [Rhodobacterales]MBF9049696.1 hypothetical protein [Rhodobacterales bacterium HKCCD4356]NNV11696.1 hypothetical protein [Roseobacter sp. HKCCD7357]NNV15880.1 hypothetical protein [Roseobacter sp. HKCCD8768]NNV25340.1 hypothetical protein [Roseobacter sp. HKCCD8192]NNV29597.1 hypothetical protein [Roseobacter sp. HKCCD9061]